MPFRVYRVLGFGVLVVGVVLLIKDLKCWGVGFWRIFGAGVWRLVFFCSVRVGVPCAYMVEGFALNGHMRNPVRDKVYTVHTHARSGYNAQLYALCPCCALASDRNMESVDCIAGPLPHCLNPDPICFLSRAACKPKLQNLKR